MEKIYMEEYKKQKQKKIDFSVVLSFVVAIMGVFSVATFGVVTNQGTDIISYAAPAGTPTGESFTFYLGKTTGSPAQPIQVVSHTTANGQGGDTFGVPLYYSDSSFESPVYCVEKTSIVDDQVVYNRSVDIDDYGLLYLLNNSSANGISVTGKNNQYLESYVTQAAIWVYLYEKYPNDSKHTLTAAELSAIQNAKSIQPTGGDVLSVEDGIWQYINRLVEDAKAVSDVAKLTVTKASDSIAKSDDSKFYQSDLITVSGNPSSALKNFDIVVSGIDGAVVVGENGEELNGTNVAVGTKFRVRVPAEKVTESVQNVAVSVKGHFDTLSGTYYVSDERQKVVTVTGATKDVSSGTEVEFIGTPNTGMNAAQTIYFIGLIILLCGVGIVYANARPVKSKQQ